ncbi:protein of unknown function [Petrocella atlantisensis]|uniref:Uncharacterized protein n=1 Tax=Petrocella atlantisensis TaxID=2173034 RepID=A0A3P7PZP7_9FIRM|nr:protein of unknown function [Petrocella atlantisensis]
MKRKIVLISQFKISKLIQADGYFFCIRKSGKVTLMELDLLKIIHLGPMNL